MEIPSFPAHYPRLLWQGRIYEDNSGHKHLVSSGASLRFRVYGSECSIWMQNVASPGEYNYFSLVIDGIHHPRQAINNESLTEHKIRFEKDAEFHDVELYKETEAWNGEIVISSVECKGEGIGEFPLPKGGNIEFIGNSITAGMASDPSMIACGEGKTYDQHNAYDAYGPRVARALDLNFAISAVSGIGIYRNWNSESPVMSDLYETTTLAGWPEDHEWDYNSFPPSIITICLGINDISDGDGVTARLPFDSVAFISKYIEFISKIHSRVPDAKILLLHLPILESHKNDILKQCLESIVEKSKSEIEDLSHIELFSFSPFISTGCSGHPGIDDHARMAAELTPRVEGLLKK